VGAKIRSRCWLWGHIWIPGIFSEGTTDNGTGSASVLGAAQAILRSGMRPRRTIRFVLFTGEEQGLDGSFAYMKQHHAEMGNHLGKPGAGFRAGGR